MKDFHQSNHYVPQSYLKGWSEDGKKIWVYRLLVPHQKTPLWKLYSIRGVAYHKHLYSRISAGSDSGEMVDDFERWLEKKFETPAQEALYKVMNDRQLSEKDIKSLVNFTAAQYIRTPAAYEKEMERCIKELSKIFEDTVKEAVNNLEELSEKIRTQEITDEFFPASISVEPSDEPDKSIIRMDAVAGRSLWLYSIKHILNNTVKILYQHTWSILHVNDRVHWATSDNPVICLNYYPNGTYDFKGGWGSIGSEILFPLSPYRMLYTQVGKKNELHLDLTYEKSLQLQQLIINNAHRCIYAKEPLSYVEKCRPRFVDEEIFKSEMDAWNKWHNEQSDAEKKIIEKRKMKKIREPKQ